MSALTSERRFANRRHAGRRLAARVLELQLSDPVVLGLPRGGVPVAYEVAVGLGAALDVFVARKVGAPWQPEFGIGAVAEGGTIVLANESVRRLGLGPDVLDRLIEREEAELERRVERYRQGRALPDLAGRDVVLVDDGLATGVTARVALTALRKHRPETLVMAAPVCPPDTARHLLDLADEVVSVLRPVHMVAVGHWYDDFEQTTDDEVVELLAVSGGGR